MEEKKKKSFLLRWAKRERAFFKEPARFHFAAEEGKNVNQQEFQRAQWNDLKGRGGMQDKEMYRALWK